MITIDYNNQSIELNPELTLIMGPADCGKSTLLETIRDAVPLSDITLDTEWSRGYVRRVTLLDEPTAHDMTDGRVHLIRQKIIDNLVEGCYTVMVSHSVADVVIAARVIYLEDHHVIADLEARDFLWDERARNYLQNCSDFC